MTFAVEPTEFEALLAAIENSPIMAPELAAAGRPVPPRPVALATETPLSSWADAGYDDIDFEILDWIVSHVRGARRTSRALMSLATLLLGTAAPFAQSLASLIDFAA